MVNCFLSLLTLPISTLYILFPWITNCIYCQVHRGYILGHHFSVVFRASQTFLFKQFFGDTILGDFSWIIIKLISKLKIANLSSIDLKISQLASMFNKYP
jgi:hypothetical protein